MKMSNPARILRRLAWSPNNIRRPKVLIVDDERVIADTFAIILSQSGYECSTAYSGWEGLRKAREVKPDMIITGVFNGDGPDGIDMAIQIHAEMPKTIIAFCSGNAAAADLYRLAIAEGHSFLTSATLLPKPAHPQELLSFVRSHLNPVEVVGAFGTCTSTRR